MGTQVNRKDYSTALNNILWRCRHRVHEWSTEKTVCVLKGLSGCGKTSFVLEHFKGRKFFYFSFFGLGEELAEKLFTEMVSEKTGVTLYGWESAFKAVSKEYRIILLDDLASISSYKRFQNAFYSHMISNILTRPFVVLITQPTDSVDGLADRYVSLNMDYLNIPEVVKLFPKLQKVDILGLCAVSGGVPKILREYDCTKPFSDNLYTMLHPSSAFFRFMPELLSHYFRKSRKNC